MKSGTSQEVRVRSRIVRRPAAASGPRPPGIPARALPPLTKKLRMTAMTAVSPERQPPPRENCYRCFRPKVNCFCDAIRPFEPRTLVAILMHPKEERKQRTGTGRLTHLCLTGSKMLTGEDFTSDVHVNRLIDDPALYPVVLFPDETARTIDREGLRVPEGRRLLVFVPDGTWRQARKILRLSTNLQALPRLRFTPPEISRFLIKKEPRPQYVSTIESVHYLLGELERLGLEPKGPARERLMAILDRLVRFQLDHAGGRRRVRLRRKPAHPTQKEIP